MTTTLLIILLIVNIPIYLLVGKLYFKDWEGFWEALKFWFTPDILSLLRGEYGEDLWQEFKLFIFIITCTFALLLQYVLIENYFLT